MIAQAVILKEQHILMVRQYVARGDIVWNFPGGGIEERETPEKACIREVKEETGYDVRIVKLLALNNNKYTYLAAVTAGELTVDRECADNEDILEAAWIPINDDDKFDGITAPIINLLRENAVQLNKPD